MRRRHWRSGDWLVIDEESGVTKYASEVTTDYTGALVTKRHADYEQPQDFVKAFNDPKPIPFSNGPNRNFEVCVFEDIFIGNTTVKAPKMGAASHIFDPGVGEMEIGCSFAVR